MGSVRPGGLDLHGFDTGNESLDRVVIAIVVGLFREDQAVGVAQLHDTGHIPPAQLFQKELSDRFSPVVVYTQTAYGGGHRECAMHLSVLLVDRVVRVEIDRFVGGDDMLCLQRVEDEPHMAIALSSVCSSR